MSMGIFFVYILKSAVCTILFYLFYRLLLSRETFHRFNRVALLSVLILSFLLPMLEVTVKQQSEVHHTILTLEQWLLLVGKTPVSEGTVNNSALPTTVPVGIQILLLIYVAGIVFFTSRTLYSVARMIHSLRFGKHYAISLENKEFIVSISGEANSEEVLRFDASGFAMLNQRANRLKLIVHSQPLSPFSWMNYIVVSQKDLDENGREILMHELAHVSCRHSWDLLLADCCIVLQWFNPASWLIKQELQNIHEYEADAKVLDAGVDIRQYQLLLIKKAVGKKHFSIANNFNRNKLKKRIIMMLKEKSNPWARLKYLYVLPLVAVAVTAFARPEVTAKAELISDLKIGDLKELIGSTNVSSKILSSKTDKRLVQDTVVAGQPVKGNSSSFTVTGKEDHSVAGKESQVLDRGGNPLFVVNKKEVDPDVVWALNVDRIESIEVLKGDSATYRYGTKGGNGVVLITLKKDTKSVDTNNGKGINLLTGQGDKRISIGKQITYYVDGVEMAADRVSVISSDKIASVNVRKEDEGAGKVYITTKEKATTGKMMVRGIVKDEQGLPVTGAIVRVRNSTVGTVADKNGIFSLEVPDNAELNISYIGMETVTTKPSPQMEIVLK